MVRVYRHSREDDRREPEVRLDSLTILDLKLSNPMSSNTDSRFASGGINIGQMT